MPADSFPPASMADATFGRLRFSACFNSGNLAEIRRACPTLARYLLPNSIDVLKIEESDGSFTGRTRADNAGTPHASTLRSWFYFGVLGGAPGTTIRIAIEGLNRQGNLYSQVAFVI